MMDQKKFNKKIQILGKLGAQLMEALHRIDLIFRQVIGKESNLYK